MKNISLNIAPYGVSPPAPPSQPGFNKPIEQTMVYSVTFNAQFDNDGEALRFATYLLNMIGTYPDA